MQAILGLERLMSVKLQRLNTSKVVNVGVKAKVWPDEQCRRVVWLSGSGVGGFWKMWKPRRGRGDRILLYFDRDPDQVHGMHRRGRSLANGSPAGKLR
jgi:hypothetical protein